MLAIITKMTLTQVSTWFANARRRLKKENKMTWSPKNKAGEDRKDDLKSDQDCAIKGLSTFDGRNVSFLINQLKILIVEAEFNNQSQLL